MHSKCGEAQQPCVRRRTDGSSPVAYLHLHRKVAEAGLRGSKCLTVEIQPRLSGIGATTVRSGRCWTSKSVKTNRRPGPDNPCAKSARPVTTQADAITPPDHSPQQAPYECTTICFPLAPSP